MKLHIVLFSFELAPHCPLLAFAWPWAGQPVASCDGQKVQVTKWSDPGSATDNRLQLSHGGQGQLHYRSGLAGDHASIICALLKTRMHSVRSVSRVAADVQAARVAALPPLLRPHNLLLVRLELRPER